MNRIEQAKILACEAHGNQPYGHVPYAVHLSDVYQTIHEFGIRDEDLLIAGWLHDVIEDTRVTYSKIRSQFGARVAEVVYACTDELGRNRRERHAKTYPKLAGNRDAMKVKLADRIANLRTGLLEGNDLIHMYAREYSEFKSVLKTPQDDEVLEKMWKTLDNIFENVRVD